MTRLSMGGKRRNERGVTGFAKGMAALTGLGLLASVACADGGNATISSAGTIAARPTGTSAPAAVGTEFPVDERIYRNQIGSLSRSLTVELGSLSTALSNPQDTEDWLQGLSKNITQSNVQLDLLRQLKPPSERYVEFDTALDASLDEYIAALDQLTSALAAADAAQITEAGTQLAAAGESFQAAAALMPPES